MMLAACAMMLLAACGVADQYSSLPKFMRQPSAEPPPPESVPDFKELVRVGANSLFTSPPSAVAVSRPRRDPSGRGFIGCVKAVVTAQMSDQPQAITLLVTIEHGKLTNRHRATPQDGCAAESYEPVQVAH
jgi:hypothetical protein